MRVPDYKSASVWAHIYAVSQPVVVRPDLGMRCPHLFISHERGHGKTCQVSAGCIEGSVTYIFYNLLQVLTSMNTIQAHQRLSQLCKRCSSTLCLQHLL